MEIFNMPNMISSSKLAKEDNGLYLIDNGYMLIIYVKKNLCSNIFQSLFGVENLNFLTMIINKIIFLMVTLVTNLKKELKIFWII